MCTHTRKYIYMYIYICMYIYVYTYAHTHTYIYIICISEVPMEATTDSPFQGSETIPGRFVSLAMDGTICGQSIWRSDRCLAGHLWLELVGGFKPSINISLSIAISQSSARTKGEPLAQCTGLMFNITVVNLNHHPKNSQKVNPVWNQRPMNQCSGFLQVSPPNVTSCSKASGSTAATPQPWSDHRFGAVTRIFIYSAIFAAIHPSIRPSLHPSIYLSIYVYIYMESHQAVRSQDRNHSPEPLRSWQIQRNLQRGIAKDLRSPHRRHGQFPMKTGAAFGFFCHHYVSKTRS